MLTTGDRVRDYVVDGVVGHGGSATVYRAHHADDPGAAVALKVLDDHHRDNVHLARLAREYDFAGTCRHPHIVAMTERGPYWLAMELLTGGPVSGLTDRADILVALGQIAAALDFAHSLGVVHCDVKPTNILLSEHFSDRGAVLVDFGVARALTDHLGRDITHIEASLPYTAPEVLYGRTPTAATDLYALACTAVELLTGATPFTRSTTFALADDHLRSPVPTFSRRIDWATHAFDSILAKAMAKDPELRYDTCTEFVTLITRALPV
ncbi:serine/threonine-protein kinase [Mycolicibacterium arenosum]|uniref:non-specific serine/threonine protein kinase n=1 Tax=Mycolicibacterium arenosum TaxID=2952157 RepID=A0ABT1M0W3_9MYCO|nr:serine/threonine-protein kinase [Mycolicibacterium sp. CAU 1645]MCP9271904.1 serine/threonine protein kinase [Mycolicibacterium sp. CAU 1645]